ncbi:DsbA family protein [Labilibacter marinus]|uniref:DsbA family protein n=1 Tax=Labilibacter marinus TaxID=1477105 RepID=UPI0008296639|nr:thioredoxin domain-containing protein [Labilibacter marinus]
MKEKRTLVVMGILSLLFCFSCKTAESDNARKIKHQIHQSKEDVVFGRNEALNTMFLYASYNCQYCRYLFTRTFPKLKEEYLDKGDLKVVVKWVEFGEDVQTLNALKAASCIYRFGKYDKLHQLLLANPNIVKSEEFNILIDDIIDKNNEIAECYLLDSEYDFIKNNVNEFRSQSFKGTPTIVINDKVYSGFISFEKLDDILKQEFKISRQ